MRRLFIGVNFTNEDKDYFVNTQKILEKYCDRAHYTRKDNLHLTLKFLGLMSEDNEQQVIEVIKKIDVEPLVLTVEHLGFFSKKRGYIGYLGFKPQPELTRLAINLNEVLVMNKLTEDHHFIYTPHITLCRNAHFILPLVDISRGINIKRDLTLTNVTLYESINIDGVLTYRPRYIRKVI